MAIKPTPRRKKGLSPAQQVGRVILGTPAGITGLGLGGVQIRQIGLQLARRKAVLEKAKKSKKKQITSKK